MRTFPLARRFPRLSRHLGVSFGFTRWLLTNGGRFDLIHAHGAWTFTTAVSLVTGKVRRSTLVLSPHEGLTEFDLAKSPVATRTAKRLLRRLYLRMFDLVVVASELERRDSRCNDRQGHSVVLRHPVHAPDNGEAVRPWDGSALRLGFLGRFDSKKNLDVLIHALAALPPRVTLRVAGDGPAEARAALHLLARDTGVRKQVEWLGFLGEADKPSFFRAIDLLVMPSAYECFGVAAAEALAAGVPVLVSPLTGVAEVVEAHGCGLVVPPTVEELARALTALLEDPARLRERAARVRAAVEQELSLTAHGHGLRREYERLLARGSA